jgi:hypothetical protein
MMGLPGTPWHGDVFRLLGCLQANSSWLDWRTIVDSDNPQTLVWVVAQAPSIDLDDFVGDLSQQLFDWVFSKGVPPDFRPASEDDALRSWIATRQRA